MKTSTVILIVVAGVAGVYVVSKLLSPTPAAAAAAARARQQGTTISSIGSALGGLIGGLFSSHGVGSANTGAGQLSSADKQIFDTVTNSSGGVDLSGVYDNSGIVDTIGDMPN